MYYIIYVTQLYNINACLVLNVVMFVECARGAKKRVLRDETQLFIARKLKK